MGGGGGGVVHGERTISLSSSFDALRYLALRSFA